MEEGTMESNRIVQQLLNGSAKIDQMRKEIHQITSLLKSYLENDPVIASKLKEDVGGEAGEFTLTQGVGEWNIHRGPLGAVSFTLDQTWGVSRRIYCSNSPEQLKVADVQGVHYSLTPLVRELSGEYPRMRVLWKPLIEAGSEL